MSNVTKYSVASAGTSATAGAAPLRFVKTLGQGGFGEVGLFANDFGRYAVAIKKIDHRNSSHRDALQLAQAEGEIHKMACRSGHRNILRLFQALDDGNTVHMFMEFAEGGSLAAMIAPGIGMPEQVARNYFRQLVEGLHYLHAIGIAHRDIKPENLLLAPDGVLKIADFGLAAVFRKAQMEATFYGQCGTKPYMAPEIMAGEPYKGPSVDVWAAGVTLLEMLTGSLPWSAAVPGSNRWESWTFALTHEGHPWTKISREPLGMLQAMLQAKFEDRLTMGKIRSHVWLHQNQWPQT